tara:strand:- start:286 stop:504 length:219 start_codon:yes stop_codon:yes gene_type:complete
MDLSPKEQAQLQAEVAMTGFIAWSKRVFLYFAIFLCIVVFACNSGVETGPGKTGSQYNGEQYNPSNLDVKKK